MSPLPGETLVDTRTIETYRKSCLRICAARLSGCDSPTAVAAAEDELNAYPNREALEEPRGVITLDPEALSQEQRRRAVDCLLEGRFLAEHAAAGEATRLKLGTKYLISPPRVLDLETCLRLLVEEENREVGRAEFLEKSQGAEPGGLLDLSLGQRHMLQMSFDLTRLSLENGRDPAGVLARQWMLVILNERTAEEILADFRDCRFFGFRAEQVLFMVQRSFEGINMRDGRFFFDPQAPRRLHNHGQMAMQQTAEKQIFRLAEGRGLDRRPLDREEVLAVLEEADDKLSYNIEDLPYLTGAIDLEALALALELGRRGFRMVMEIVANNPLKPQKGGLAAWDPALGRNVMIESFQLLDLPNEDIRFLNRNFNHYPKPGAAFEALSRGLPMPLAVKGGFIYFQPVQGDLNFQLQTAFVQRRVLKPISNWKSAATTPAALAAMAAQDRQDGFRDFAQDLLQRRL